MTSAHECDSGDFDRTICPAPCGAMHSYCDTCGKRQDVCAHDKGGGGSDVTQLVTADRDALAAALHAVREDDEHAPFAAASRCRYCYSLADALLASGVVRAVDGLAEDEALIETQFAVRYGDGEVEGEWSDVHVAADFIAAMRRSIESQGWDSAAYEPMVVVTRQVATSKHETDWVEAPR